MNTKSILAGLLLLGTAGAAYAYVKGKKDEPEVDPNLPDVFDTPATTAKKTTPKVPTLNYDFKFSKSDKAYVSEMQRLIGVNSDGVWGKQTQAALPPGLNSSFTLNQLITAIKIKNTPQDEKNKATLNSLLAELAATPNKQTKQVLNPNGTVGYQKDYNTMKTILTTVLTTLKKIGFAPDQVGIAYYNKYKRSLAVDFNLSYLPAINGLGNPSVESSGSIISMI